MKKVSVIILHYNSLQNTLDCIESLQKIVVPKGTQIEIIVVDNGSKENIKYRGVKIIKNKENLGFAEGNNVGIRYALENGADFVLILNNDTYVEKNFLEELLQVGKQDNKIGILIPKIYFAPGFEFHKDRYEKNELGRVFWYAGGEIDWANVIGHHRGVDEVDRGQYDKIEETETATGCCMLIKREVFEKVGLLDDKYFLYYEDNDLSMRAKKKSFKIMYVPASLIWHKNAGSAGGSGSMLQDYYITRNRLLFGLRYAPPRSRFALFRESLSLLIKGREWQKRGVLDFYLKKLGKGSYKV